MKKVMAMLMMLTVVLTGCFSQYYNGEHFSVKRYTDEWEMVMNDEFDHAGLPSDQLWSYETGLIRNKECQDYQNAELKNTRIEYGRLIIEAHHEPVENLNPSQDKKDWKARKFSDFSSGSINTLDSFAIQYGRIEVSAKLPRAKGAWPAIWMMGTDRKVVGWPKCGEIDIMEHVSPDSNLIYGTCHWAVNQGTKNHKSKGGKIKVCPEQLSAQFNLYAIEWDKEKIDFFFNDQKYFTMKIDDKPNENCVFHKPHYILLNLAVGGWAGKPDPKDFPAQFEVDFIRCYKKINP